MRAALRKWRHALPWIVLVCVLFGSAMTLYTCFYQADMYRSAYTLYALPNTADAERSPLEGARMLARDLQSLTETEAFRRTVLRSTESDGLSYVQVKGIDGSHMIEVEVIGPDAQIVKGMANAIGRELCAQAPDLLNARSVREMEPAAAVLEPIGPNRPLKIAVTMALVFVLGSLLACVLGSNRQPLSFDDEQADEFFLGAIPDLRREMKRYEKLRRRGKVKGTLLDMVSRLMRESLRKTALCVRTAEAGGSVVLVTAQREDHQTPAVTVLMACELAQQGFRVLLLETDGERGSMSRYLGVKAHADLYDYLKGRAEMGEMLNRTPIETLSFVDALHPNITVADYAATQSFADFLASARNHFDLIILHARDMVRASDAAMLSLLADTVLFTVRNRQSTLDEVEDTARILSNLGRPAHGVVFTGVHPAHLVQDD